MKKFVYSFLILFSGFIGCTSTYAPEAHLSAEEKTQIEQILMRYAFDGPKGADSQSKFDSKYDSVYLRNASHFKLTKWHRTREGKVYFEWRRRAPSMIEKWVATGGVLELSPDGKLSFYQEVYRTWKLDPTRLDRRSDLFFDYMKAGKDLSPYYTSNIKDTEHIEFPNETTEFDISTGSWVKAG